MKEYELSVLFHPDLEMNLDPSLDKIRKIVTGNGGEIVKEDADGKKRMAYKISKNDFAIYHFFTVNLPPEAPMRIAAVLNITDDVLRYMLVTVDPKKAKMDAARKAREEGRAAHLAKLEAEEAGEKAAEAAEVSESAETGNSEEAKAEDTKADEKAEKEAVEEK